jgi:hypothetical protein
MWDFPKSCAALVTSQSPHSAGSDPAAVIDASFGPNPSFCSIHRKAYLPIADRVPVALEHQRISDLSLFNVGFVISPELTQLDFTGPLQVLARLPQSATKLPCPAEQIRGPLDYPMSTDLGPRLGRRPMNGVYTLITRDAGVGRRFQRFWTDIVALSKIRVHKNQRFGYIISPKTK